MREVHVVLTPENVELEHELAGLGIRAAAWSVDLVITGILTSLLLVPIGLSQIVLGSFATALSFVVAFVVQWGYGAVMEWALYGQTLGKRWLGLRVLGVDGLRISFAQAVIRNLVRIVDLMPFGYLVGACSTLIDAQRRRLGDIAAGTVVVRERRVPRPAAVVPEAERYNSFVADPSVVIAARQITAPERDVMTALAIRRDRLPIGVRQALFARLAKHFEGRLGVSRPPYFSEEKYVLNLTAVALGGAADRGPTRGTRSEDARMEP